MTPTSQNTARSLWQASEAPIPGQHRQPINTTWTLHKISSHPKNVLGYHDSALNLCVTGLQQSDQAPAPDVP